MYAQVQKLAPLSGISLTSEDKAIIAWIRSAKWELVTDAKEPKPLRAKVPEFFKGARLYHMQATTGNASQGGLDLFIKKLSIQNVISKQAAYPVTGHGNQPRFLTLAKVDLDNLGVGQDDEDED